MNSDMPLECSVFVSSSVSLGLKPSANAPLLLLFYCLYRFLILGLPLQIISMWVFFDLSFHILNGANIYKNIHTLLFSLAYQCSNPYLSILTILYFKVKANYHIDFFSWYLIKDHENSKRKISLNQIFNHKELCGWCKRLKKFFRVKEMQIKLILFLF